MMWSVAPTVAALERIRAERIVAVLRRVPNLDSVVDQLVEGGIRIVEVTLDSPDALDSIARLSTRSDVTVLAGTVRSVRDAETAAAAGAAACVAPALVPEVVERCATLGVPAIPGALTPSEIESARALGVDLVKLFPAGLVGPQYVRDVLTPLADVPLLVTGGVDATNARAFIDAGAAAVGAGSALTRATDVAAEARRLVTALAKR